jgi:hypothetical protein
MKTESQRIGKQYGTQEAVGNGLENTPLNAGKVLTHKPYIIEKNNLVSELEVIVATIGGIGNLNNSLP